MIQKNRFFRRTLRVLEKKILSNSAIVKKIDQNTKNEDIENKIPDVSGLVTTAALIAKTIEIEYKILDITNLASKAGFNARSTEVKNKIPDITNLATKTALDTKATEIGNKALIPHVLLLPLNLIDQQKISSDTIMRKATKNLATESQLYDAFDIQTKIEEK